MAFRINSELRFQSVHKHLIMNNYCCSPLRQCSGLISRGESSCNNAIFKTTDVISCARTHNNTYAFNQTGLDTGDVEGDGMIIQNQSAIALAKY